MKKFKNPILVTKPYMPPYEEFCEGLSEIWDNQWLTNNGPVLQRYQKELQDFFETQNISLFNNGTLALQIALQGLGISGEVITTPFKQLGVRPRNRSLYLFDLAGKSRKLQMMTRNCLALAAESRKRASIAS